MNLETTKFCITGTEDGMHVEIEGSAMDLTNLIANAIHDSEEIEMVLMMALMAIHAKKAKDDKGEAGLEELLMKMKPKAQA